MEVMGSTEFINWQAYYKIDPFGNARRDLRAGLQTAPIINLLAKKGSRRVKPSDFLMKFSKFAKKKRQSPNVMKAILQAVADKAKVIADIKRKKRIKDKDV